MAEIKSGSKPSALALVTAADTPEGRSIAIALARAGYRLGLLQSDQAAAAVALSELPGQEKAKHESITVNLADPRALSAAALALSGRLGQVTALVHVALSAAPPAGAEGLDPGQLATDIAAGAGGFLALSLALLPEMLGAQTGTLCLLAGSSSTAAGGATFPSSLAGGGASLGASLGAVRELSDRVMGTPLRSIALYTPAAARGPLSSAQLGVIATQLGFEPSPELIDNGCFLDLSAPKIRGRIEFLRPPTLAAPSAPVALVSAPVAAAPSPNDQVGEKLAQTFRAAFGLAPGSEVLHLAIGSVKRWDSLGHLKLMMEVEQALRVRLPAEAFARIQSYRDLEKAVRAYLPAL